MLILFANCASRPAPGVVPAEHLFAELFTLYHDYLLTVEAADIGVLLDAENRLSGTQKRALLTVAEQGAARARADIQAEPEHAGHHLLLGLHLSVVSRARSTLNNLLEGRASSIRRAYTESIRLDREHAGGAALRLKGKFLMSAPWPFRDRKGAEKALAEAAAIRDVPQIHLFMGDLRFAQGRRADARRAWKRAIEMPSHAAERAADSQIRELAKRRIRLTR